MSDFADPVTGTLLGTAVGDAIGLPREGLSRRRAARLFGTPPLGHRFLFGRGMVSDDTEHACMTAQALLRAPDDPERFARSLAWRLRGWLLALPAGTGRATLRAVVKLCVGFPPHRSGVYSAGNGPAMRAPLLGVCLGDDPDKLRAYVRASTRLTHTDPRAERGAYLVAVAAHHGSRHGPADVTWPRYQEALQRAAAEFDPELQGLLLQVEHHLARAASTGELADALGLRKGVSGYIYHTVPIALYGWLRWPGDFRRAVEEVITLGGDADTTGAVVGALAGATCGAAQIPATWLDGLCEWPRSVRWLRGLAERLAEECTQRDRSAGLGPCRLFWPGVLPRNLLFLAVVLAHGLRRLLPPY